MSEQVKETTAVEEVQNVEVTAEGAAAKEETPTAKTYTQEEFQTALDEQIKKRLARETKKFEKQLAEMQKPAENQVSLEEENKTLKEQLSSLNVQILNLEAAKVASELNVKPERLEAFIKIADLSNISLDSKGTYKDEIRDILEAAAKEFPEFLKAAEPKKEAEFVKVGLPQTEQNKNDDLKSQIYQGLGLK